MSQVISTSTPTQGMYFTPYSQKFRSYYDHNDSKVKYYIVPSFGEYTKLVGDNIILDGLEVDNVSRTNTTVSCQVKVGRLLINDTYVEVASNTTITYEKANVLDDSGFFVLSARFYNLETLRSNKLKFHLTYFNSDNTSFESFDTTKNRVILGIFNFVKFGSNIISFTLDTILEDITLDGIVFNIRNDLTNSDSVIDGEYVISVNTSSLPGGKYSGGEDILTLKNIYPENIKAITI
jgi:hypothetical protein